MERLTCRCSGRNAIDCVLVLQPIFCTLQSISSVVPMETLWVVDSLVMIYMSLVGWQAILIVTRWIFDWVRYEI